MHNLNYKYVTYAASHGKLPVVERTGHGVFVYSNGEISTEHRYKGEFGPQKRLCSILRQMKVRCYNPKYHAFNAYGGRGITICDEWRNNTAAFIEWALSHGYRDDLTIDRMDVNKGYEPSNCQWISVTENSAKHSPPGTFA